MHKFLCIKNTYECNLKCWYCSTHGHQTMSVDQIEELYKRHSPSETLLIGGEPLYLGPEYYLDLLNRGIQFSIQSNLTLYNDRWNEVFNHSNFQGLSVSGDKFASTDEFFQIYEKVREATNSSPMVLIVLDGDYGYSKIKAESWCREAFKRNFSLRINYLAPLGRAYDHALSILKVSRAHDIFTDLIPLWKESGFKVLQPHTYIIEFLAYRNKSICPYICNCTSGNSIITIEPDLTEYPCPALGDLHLQKEDLVKPVPQDCLYCEFFGLCRGCYFRNWEVEMEKDIDYCRSSKRFFKALQDECEAYIAQSPNNIS